jgi:opacity protein-like surface antigen
MTKLKLLGAAAVLATALATPVMAQEATQEPGMIGFNYPNSDYMTGGYGVRLPHNSGRYPRMPGGYVAYEYDVGPVGVAIAPAPVIVAPVGPGPYGAYAYDPY